MKNRMQRMWVKGLVACLGIFLGGVGIPQEAGAQRLEKVNLSASDRSLSFLPLFVGEKRGLYREEGINLTILQLGSSLGVKALIAGDVGYMASLGGMIRAAAKGAPIKALSSYYVQNVFYLVTSPQIRTAQDLKGKVLGTSLFGGSADTAMRLGLKSLGIDPDRDVTIVQVGGGGNRFAALIGGSIVGVALAPPENTMAVQRGFKELLDLGELMKTPVSGLGSSKKWVEQHPAQVKRMVRAGLKSLLFVRERQEETIGLMQQIWGLDRELAKGAYASVYKALGKDGGFDMQGLQVIIDLDLQRAKEKQVTPTAEMVDLRFLQEVWREMGIRH